MYRRIVQQRSRILLLLAVLISLAFIPTTSAQTFSFGISGASGDCSLSVTVEAIAPSDITTILTGRLGIVLYGGDNNAFAYATLPFASNVNLDLNYVEIGTPSPGSVKGKIFAVPGSANSVGAIEGGIHIATATISLSNLEDCTGIDVPSAVLEITVTIDDDPLAPPVPVFFDGRLNDFDSSSPIVVFPYTVDDENGLQVYDVDGNLVLLGTPEAIAAVEECPDVNTLILENEDLDITIWRLSSCEYQVMAPTGEPGKYYIIILDTLYDNTFYISFEEYILP